MKWRITPGLLVIALFLPSVAVQAQEYLTPRFSSFGSGHQAGTTPSDELDGDSLYYQDDTSPWRISGDMRITPFVSLELGYQQFVRPGEGHAPTENNAWSLSGLLSLPLDSGLAPYARLGQMFWAAEPSADNISPDGRRDLYYGLGLRYGLAEQLDLHFEYERFSQDESDYGMSSMNLQLSF